MIINHNIYNHLSADLVPKTRRTTHKSSELRNVYNNMSRYNKKSPLYLLSLSDSKQSRMINIKEAATTLRDVTTTFSDMNSPIYSKKLLHSDDPSSISGAFKKGDLKFLPEELKISIDSLATKQINTGNYLQSNKRDLKPGNYTFDLKTNVATSHFNISVTSGDTNIDIQKKIVQYINNRALDVKASLLQEQNSSALMLASVDTGVPTSEDGLHFSLVSEDSSEDIVSVLGLNNISNMASNSSFSINGENHFSSSNQISINQMIELDFHKISDKPVTISFVPDTNDALEQVDMLVEAYNSLVDLSKKTDPTKGSSRNLYKDVSIIVDNHKQELQEAGLTIDQDNKLSTNQELLVQNVRNGKFAKLFQDTSFKSDLMAATSRLTLDPVAYINKIVVTYPNTSHKFSTAYNKSLYSGLIYNNYA